MLDQEKFVNVDDFDTEDWRLDEPPKSVQHYLKQVQADRSRQADVVTVEFDAERFSKHRTVSVQQEHQPSGSLAHVPPLEWQKFQVAQFSDMRLKVAKVKANMKQNGQLPKIAFPESDDEDGWRCFCASNPQSTADTQAVDGSPLTSRVFALSGPQAIELLEFHVKWLDEDGYRRNRMQWLYALCCVLEKPLEPDVCSTLRTLARHCRTLRRTYETEQTTVQRELSWFITIVARYFDQSDLAEC